jgi:hypothetical protein
MFASAVELPDQASLLVAGASALGGLVIARVRAPIASLRAPALCVGAVALAGLLRVAAIVASELAGEVLRSQPSALGIASRSLATASLLCEVAAMLIALAWLSAAPRSPRPWRRGVGALVPIAAALATFAALRGLAPDASGAALLIGRAIGRLLVAPDPYASEPVRIFVEITAWLLIVLALVAPRALRSPQGAAERPLASAFALALLARGQLETPLCALALLLAASTVALHPGIGPVPEDESKSA